MRIQHANTGVSKIPNPGRRRQGAATVELAVVSVFLMSVMLGMIEVTRAAQVKNYLTDTARSGCRVAIQPGSTTKSVKDNINTILTDNGIDSSFATITVLVNNNNVDVSTAQRYDQISVKIALPISKVNWITPLYLSSTAVQSETLVMMHH